MQQRSEPEKMVSENHDSTPETPTVGDERAVPKMPRGPFGTEPDSVPDAADNADPTPDTGSEASPPPDDITVFQEALHARLVDTIKTVYDPEIPVDIYELGLIYEIEIDEEAAVTVSMTLTSPACPVAGALVGEVEEKVCQTDGVKSGKVELVWDPPWTPDLMSESAKLELGMM